VVEHLPNEHEALYSIPSAEKNKQTKKPKKKTNTKMGGSSS
jgi:hypothetical protein